MNKTIILIALALLTAAPAQAQSTEPLLSLSPESIKQVDDTALARLNVQLAFFTIKCNGVPTENAMIVAQEHKKRGLPPIQADVLKMIEEADQARADVGALCARLGSLYRKTNLMQ